ncbi:porphobilinogen deaminase Hem3 [Apiospora rasikravindrae]|uniref:Porphobilinogen deaminase Hem3 n=1 Tax=Apiospora rasikravindrae TaxID=990691 RepID=A0ABR1RZ88_9PEZI
MANSNETYDTEAFKAKIYHAELPDDIGAILRLLEDYSGILPQDVNAHIHAIDASPEARQNVGRQALQLHRPLPLPDPRLRPEPALPIRPVAPAGPGSTATFLDMACCVGQVLRHLAWSGVDPSRLYGADLERPFIEAGYDLFRDRDAAFGKGATLVVGDALAEGEGGVDGDPALEVLDGKISIVHASAFFHLFTWRDQVVAAKRVVRFFREKDEGGEAIVFGRQVASTSPREITGPRGERRFLHDAATWQRLWDEVGEATGTRWRTEVEMADEGQGETGALADASKKRMNFACFKV